MRPSSSAKPRRSRPAPTEGAAALPARAATAAARVEKAPGSGLHPAALELVAVAEQVRDTTDVGLLFREHEGRSLPGAAGATGAADAMNVALRVLRRVVVDDVRD